MTTTCRRATAVAATVAALALTTVAPARAVTATAYDRVEPGWSRAHVQRVFGDAGERVLMFAGEHRRHLIKSYPADAGGSYVVEYVGPLSGSPYAGPYRVLRKRATS